ncbi:tRNA (cytidine(34)-2'-O)-methyltransferase [Alphaproteobacteria bacterium]|jgi:tRNA (cytidine/uridine-2'-O-)-methyltransferase|nr:tRNA (cytidine(34)-2'-O)-methyltransferase [Alphaproteobacteria bacterium]
MISIVLYCPEIPPNTGNIMRLCSNTGFTLHIIKPTGFPLDNKSLIRAKLDYYSSITPKIYIDFNDFKKQVDLKNVFAITKFGNQIYSKVKFKRNIFLLFGSETKGLPNDILDLLSHRSLRVPMVDQSRSINLSNTVALVAYEAWKQLKFSGAKL